MRFQKNQGEKSEGSQTPELQKEKKKKIGH